MLLAATGGASAATTPALEARLDATPPDARVGVIATLDDQVAGGRFAGRPEALIRALRRTARTSQDEVADEVDGPVQGFWLVNAIAFCGTPAEIRAVAADPGVASVGLDGRVRIADGARTAAAPFPDAGAGDWGLTAIRVPAVWSSYGLRGAGVTVGSIDTGVVVSHPDLAGKVVAWRDFVGASPVPRDENGHGTHTAGTIVGGGAGGAAIGVAPEARLVVARAMDANGSGSASDLIAAAEWMTDPDGNPATDDAPAVINNSWSSPNANDTWFRPMVRRWLELGIVPVFATGNTGPAAGTVGSPASYPESLAVGALERGDLAADFSARGPVVWQDYDGTGPAAGTALLKPDLSAPGSGIVSSVGAGYLSYSGTSMAAPHVAGVAALVAQADPTLPAGRIVDVLRASATDVGAAGPDQPTGAGRVDALRAVEGVVGAAPDTLFAHTPAAATAAASVRYDLALTGALLARVRVDGGAWSAPSPALTLSLPLAEGRHVVEAQAVDGAGRADPSPARHAVTVDRTPPRLAIAWSRRGTAALFRARSRDDLSGVVPGTLRWSFGEGRLARGARVTRRFAEGRARRVVLSARDAAGNEAFAARRFVPRPAGAVRALRATRRPRAGARALSVTGRLVRPARVTATLRPLRSPVRAAGSGLAASFEREVLGRPVARAVLRPARRGGFRLRVPVGRLKPGAYVLVVLPAERRASPGRLRLTRRIEIS